MSDPTKQTDDALPLYHGFAAQTPQVERRLARLDEQVGALALALDHVQESTHTQQDQTAALLRAFTAAERGQAINERLAELITLLTDQGEQTSALAAAVQELARARDVQTLADEVARQTQLEALEGRMAKLVRTQFKSNTLNESQLGQLESALSALREVAELREARVDERQSRDEARLDGARQQGRRELVADLLPGIDGMELVLQNGRELLMRQQAALAAAHEQNQRARAAPTASAPPPTWRDRLRATLGGQAPATPMPAQPVAPANAPANAEQLAQLQTLLEDTDSWLAGLALAHERFLALLAAEEIETIDALGQPFDPRLHVAIDAVEDAAHAPNVVQVVRQGYRQGERVLRYAEVVVARAPSAEAADAHKD